MTGVPQSRLGTVSPDLELGILLDRSPTQVTLDFNLLAYDRELGFESRHFGPQRIEAEPHRLFDFIYARASSLLPEEESGFFADFGSYLSDLLLPEDLRSLLVSLSAPGRTLQIHSQEPWIPWELIRLDVLGQDAEVLPQLFLCEAFQLSRWLDRRAQPLRFPFESLALVIPDDSKLDVSREKDFLEKLQSQNRAVEQVKALPDVLRQALASGRFDTLHFSGHGRPTDLPDQAVIQLEELTEFTPVNLRGEARRLGETRPLVFFNACSTGRGGFSLTGLGGWASHFLAVGAGAFIGTWWEIKNSKAGEFAQAFYEAFLDGVPIARAVQRAREAIRSESDGTWLAYTLYAHPLARVGHPSPSERLFVTELQFGHREEPRLSLPERQWDPESSPPGALLRADHSVVPFHGREQESENLYSWCQEAHPAQVRLYTGAGGMGKTRLALEMARLLKVEGWQAAFLEDTSSTAVVSRTTSESTQEIWNKLTRVGKPVLAVVDYAESQQRVLISLLSRMIAHRGPPFRLLLLARGEEDWWKGLKKKGAGVGEFLEGPRTSVRALAPLALSVEDRVWSWRLAAKAFSRVLREPEPEEPPDHLDAGYFERVLLLHMSVLVKMDGVNVQDEDGILDHILNREQRYWERRVEDWSLPSTVIPGLSRALAAITLAGGASGESVAVSDLRKLEFFADRPRDVLIAVVRLLHECYPGRLWIEPLQPDLLGERLFERELIAGAEDLLKVATGL